MSLNIALTGGIGTGKSLVASIFEKLGAELFRADDVAKELMRSHPQLRDAIRTQLGDESYKTDGSLNTTYLAAQVFNDATKLNALNALVHPFVQWKLEEAKSHCTKPVFVMEAALVYESALEDKFDYVVVVDADEAIRVARTMAREHSSEEDVRRRMESQMPQEDKVDAADFVLKNNGTPAELEVAARNLFTIISILPPRDESDRT